MHACMGVHGCVMVKYECVRERERVKEKRRKIQRVRERDVD